MRIVTFFEEIVKDYARLCNGLFLLDISVNNYCSYKTSTCNGHCGAGVLSMIKVPLIHLSYPLYLNPGECGAATSLV